jgi:glycosyltransferase involved in cell wall biosynthesis
MTMDAAAAGSTMAAWSDRDRPLITIILLCYNHENFVAEAVHGVLSQTYAPLEIIVFDDCSTDRTAEIVEHIIAPHADRPDLRFIRNPTNLGSNAVGRAALSMAKGEFVLVTCGDDVMLPHMVEEMARVWTEEGVSLVTANAYYIDENSKPLNRTFRDPERPADDSFETLARDGSNACCFGPAIGFERAIYENFDWVPRYLRAYDIMYPFYAYLHKGAKFISEPLLKYRVHGENTSLSLQLEKLNSLEKSLIEERMYIGHIAHATLMTEVLDQLHSEEPERYGPVVQRIMPLLKIQLAETAKKLARLSRRSGTLVAER